MSKMKILYGVMGVGNGHISKARQVAPYLREYGAEVDFLFSGRPADQFSDMAVFGDYQTREGFSFVINDGKIKKRKTVRAAFDKWPRLQADVKTLDLSGYDLVIADYEPITARASMRHKIPSIGFGHQYAFQKATPKPNQIDQRLVMNKLHHMAPADVRIGIHWSAFGQSNIVPPVVPADLKNGDVNPRKILTYLPFEHLDSVIDLAREFEGYSFHIYHPDVSESYSQHNLVLEKISGKFQQDFTDCAGVITNAGFETPSEALHLGKSIFAKALNGQPEQVANAKALKSLGLATVKKNLKAKHIESWLGGLGDAKRIIYPNVSEAFAKWVVAGDYSPRSVENLSQSLWGKVEHNGLDIG